jgi:hypothetical protein
VKYLHASNWGSIVSIMNMLNRSYDCFLIFECFFVCKVFCVTKVDSALYDVKHTVSIHTLSDLCRSCYPEDPVQVKFCASLN